MPKISNLDPIYNIGQSKDELAILNDTLSETRRVTVTNLLKKSQPMKYVSKTSNYTLNLTDDNIIAVNANAGNVVITLPGASTITDDNCVHEFFVWQIGAGSAGNNTVTVQLSGGDKFLQGHNKIVIEGVGGVAHIGGMYGQWGNMQIEEIVVQARRSTTWAASNFSSYTAIPFNTTDRESNSSAIEHNNSNVTRIDCKVSGWYNVSADVCMDSTGGAAWETKIKIRKNGSTDIAGTEVITGNYGDEDNSAHITTRQIKLAKNDYLELLAQQTNLTGNMISAVFSVRTNA